MPETPARTRAPKVDATLKAAVELARESAEAIAHPRRVGEHLGELLKGVNLEFDGNQMSHT